MMFSRPLALWMALVAMTGCVTTHSPDDASGVDAAMPPDAVHGTDALLPVDAVEVPDAFVPPDAFCPDSDRDGERDIRCGGTDCDDADAQLSSTRVRCGTPVSVTRCDGAMRVDSSCGGDTPYCDARTGACVADACGDGVVHSNEQCDAADPDVCTECHRACHSSQTAPHRWSVTQGSSQPSRS